LKRSRAPSFWKTVFSLRKTSVVDEIPKKAPRLAKLYGDTPTTT